MQLTIGQNTFVVALENNATVAELVKLLPLDVKMMELNGNEKYYCLDGHLPTNEQPVRQINAGDIMLWQDNYLVLFYRSFTTAYSYTKIGHITDVTDLAAAVGTGNVQVQWSQR